MEEDNLHSRLRPTEIQSLECDLRDEWDRKKGSQDQKLIGQPY